MVIFNPTPGRPAGIPAVLAIVLLSGCFAEYDTGNNLFELSNDDQYRDLAEHWAPRLYQDTDDSYYKGEYITNFNFDGDYNGKNNWANLANVTSVPAHVYYAVSETETHYFIGYYIFHPRDWHECLSLDRHENDWEGAVLAVAKDGGYGSLVALETLAHSRIYQYAYASGIVSGTDNVDGTVRLYDGSHPEIFIEAKGHGVYGCDSRCDSAPGGDGIVYYAGPTADSPTGGSGNWTREYSYRLIAMDADGSFDGNEGLWHRRYDICDTCTFGSWGALRGDDYKTNAANMPWFWDDSNDGQSYAGDFGCNPAMLFDVHLSGTPLDSNFSHTYINHPYRTHTIDIDSVRSDKNRDPFGGRSDIYVRVIAHDSPAGTDKVLDADAWKKNSADPGTWYSFRYGGHNAEGQTHFGDTVSKHSFCREAPASIEVAVYDSDGVDSDDYMGSIAIEGSADFSSGIDLGDARIKFVLTEH